MTIFVFYFGQNLTSKRNFYTIFVEYKNKYIFKIDEKTEEPRNAYDVDKYAFDTYLYANKKDLIWIGVKSKDYKFINFLYKAQWPKEVSCINNLKTLFGLHKIGYSKEDIYFLLNENF